MEQTLRNTKRENMNTTIMHHKDDEKLLSASLYRNLHVMQRFHKPTSDFLKCFDQHMFVKSNPKAFIHVIHFIFTCLDAAEFNKRFLWPVFDKAGETRFRHSTLDYMNHLNINHRMGFETLKLHNIHIPGGLKFIKIIHKFSVLIMTEEMKRHTGPIPEPHQIPDANEQLKKLEERVDNGLDYVRRLQAKSNLLSERIDEMNGKMESLFHGSVYATTGTQKRCLSCLANKWRDQLNNAVQNEIQPQLQRINVFSNKCVELEQMLTKLFVDRKDNCIQYEKDNLAIAQNVLMKWNPGLQSAIHGMIESKAIDFDKLFQVFVYVLPKILEKIEKFECRGLEAIEFESNEIDILYSKASQLETGMTDLQKILEPFLKSEEEKFRQFCSNVPKLPFNVMQTPTIARRNQTTSMRNRLALMDDTNMKLFNETSTTIPSTLKKKKLNLNKTISAAQSSSRSQMDAMEILKRNSKKSTAKNLYTTFTNNLGSQSMLSTPQLSSTLCSRSGNSRLNKNNNKNQLKLSPILPTHIYSDVVQTASMLTPNAQSLTKKFPQFNQPNLFLRQSPTRRWDITDHTIKVPKILEENENHPIENDVNKVDNDVDDVIVGMNIMRTEGNELIGNISDGILNDVSTN